MQCMRCIPSFWFVVRYGNNSYIHPGKVTFMITLLVRMDYVPWNTVYSSKCIVFPKVKVRIRVQGVYYISKL